MAWCSAKESIRNYVLDTKNETCSNENLTWFQAFIVISCMDKMDTCIRGDQCHNFNFGLITIFWFEPTWSNFHTFLLPTKPIFQTFGSQKSLKLTYTSQKSFRFILLSSSKFISGECEVLKIVFQYCSFCMHNSLFAQTFQIL